MKNIKEAKVTNELIKKTEKIEKNDLWKIPKAFLLGTILLLCGCIGMNSGFDCNVSSGGSCSPMGTIDKMADMGEFSEYKTIESNIVKAGKYPNQGYFSSKAFSAISAANSSSAANASATSIANFAKSHPLRSNEAIQKIWMGPYEDENGNYHEPAYVYAVVKKARWLAETEQSIKD